MVKLIIWEHLTFAKKPVVGAESSLGNSEGDLRSHCTANLPLGDAPYYSSSRCYETR